MDKQSFILIQEWMVDTGYTGADLIAFAIVWDGFLKGWKLSSIKRFADRYNIVIPDYIWPAVLRLRKDLDEKLLKMREDLDEK